MSSFINEESINDKAQIAVDFVGQYCDMLLDAPNTPDLALARPVFIKALNFLDTYFSEENDGNN